MTAVPALTEQEKYLVAILQDESGIDIAEFILGDHKNKEKDGLYRAWPMHHYWYRCPDPQQASQGSRSSGKSYSIRLRAMAFPFLHPQQEMVITAPEGGNILTITKEIESIFRNNRLMREMMIAGSGAITHKPFVITFKHGGTIKGILPQRTGLNLKGLHPLWLEVDEAQDFYPAAWEEIFETIQQGVDVARWRIHGVTRGLRDKFYEFTQPNSGWTVHHYPAMYRPTWSEEEKQKKIRLYGGSKANAAYRRNIFGTHGDETSILFVLYRLLACVDTDEESEYNTREYLKIDISDGMLKESGSILPLLDLSVAHKKDYDQFWIGMDVGVVVDPSVVVVFGVAPPVKRGAPNRLKLLAKITLNQIPNPDQAQAVLHVISHYRPQCFAMDRTGLGLPLFQDIQFAVREDPDLKPLLDRIKGYNFSENIVVGIDDQVEVDEYRRENPDPEIKQNVKERATDVLRAMVDEKSLVLPWDVDLIEEFRGQTYTFSKAKTVSEQQTRRRIFSEGAWHALDACRMGALGYSQHLLDSQLAAKEQEFDAVPTIFLS